MKKFKEMEMLLEEEIVKRNMERIKKAEIIAEIKEAEIEGKFNEEIEAHIMKMHIATGKLKEAEDMKKIEETLNEEMEAEIEKMKREEKKLKEAEDIMKKVKEAKNREKIKEAEITKKIKNMIEAECLEMMVVEIMRKEAEVLNIEKIKESEEDENTSSMASDSTSRTKHPNIGTIRKAAAKLFDASMERCDFSNIKQPALISSCAKEEYGVYTCDTVLMIWPELKKIGTKLQGPKDVGEEILRNLPQSDMIEETPSLHSVGFLSFKISGKWMAKGDTFLYLLNTQARIRSITNKSHKDISELKNVIRASCFAVLPHILCKYLYNLCEIFNRYFVSTFARGWRSRFSLLLCEATAVVMDKCFNLLEITPQSFKNELGVTQLIYGAQLSVERPIDVGSNPPRIPNTRFEPFSIHLHVYPNPESDCELQLIKVFGYVEVADTYGLRSDGWTLTNRPDVLYVELFKRLWTDPIYIRNGGCLSFGNPSCCRSVPFSSSMGIAMGLVAINEKEDDIFPICNHWWDLDFSAFLESNLDGSCGHYAMEGEGGQVQINYILLRDAVDATLEVTFSTSLENLQVCAEIVAYYEGGFTFDCEVVEKTFYTASLFELKSSIFKSGPIQLKKSQMAVPRKGSLIIKAYLIEVNSWSKILSTSCDFPAQTNGSSQRCLEGNDCSFEVKVNWSYCQDDL
ncbi:hypothetical protein CTI12_AA094790 [Artemisia annua]|uniref:arginine--tRNA ligase n=1 Tax=Artemisia annua TaxID=35608 RepID=A0A2U1PYV9_ARTAN|nr:hypothetical protein CTI12_AA094790 [Artemisia annua]